MKRVVDWFCIVAALAFAAGAISGQGIRREETRAWKLAFVRGGGVWVANGDGSGQKRVIRRGCAPAWSPDRTRIAFARDGDIWVANADGTGQKRLTYLRQTRKIWDDAIEISWRPRTDRITFCRYEEFIVTRRVNRWLDPPPTERGQWGISMFNVDSRGRDHGRVSAWLDLQTQAGIGYFSDYTGPFWNRRGDRFLYTANGDIWLASRSPQNDPYSRQGWDYTRLAAVAHYDEADWRADRSSHAARHLSTSPDGRFLAYGFEEVGHPWSEVHLLSVDLNAATCGDHRILSEPEIGGRWPSFSPDGRFVAYEGLGLRGNEIWTVDVASKAQIRLIDDGEQPAW